MDAFVARTAAEIDQLVADDFDDEQRVAERIEELASRPNTAALQRPCTASVPSRIAQQPSVLACLAHLTTKDNESEESFYARIILTARQQQSQQPHQPTAGTKAEKRSSSSQQRGAIDKHAAPTSRQPTDATHADQKRESVADVYVLPSRTHSPPLGSSRPSSSSSASSLSVLSSHHSATSTSSTSATPRSQLSDSAYNDRDRQHRSSAMSVQSTNLGHFSSLERDMWHAEQLHIDYASSASDRPLSRRTSIRSRFPAINK